MVISLPLFACDFFGARLRTPPHVNLAITPARPVGPPRMAELSSIDREYLSKVRARLLSSATRSAQQKVSPSSTSQSAFSPPELSGPGSEEFALGMDAFNRGQYQTSVPHFDAAVTAAGAAGARGGRLALWLAQALDAAGRRADAVQTLEALLGHADAEVARTASELLFIVTAPRLELGKECFVEVPEIEDEFRGEGRRRLVAAGLERRMKERCRIPEKYSLEWYMQNERGRRKWDGEEGNSWMVVAGIAAGGAAFLLGAMPWGMPR